MSELTSVQWFSSVTFGAIAFAPFTRQLPHGFLNWRHQPGRVPRRPTVGGRNRAARGRDSALRNPLKRSLLSGALGPGAQERLAHERVGERLQRLGPVVGIDRAALRRGPHSAVPADL